MSIQTYEIVDEFEGFSTMSFDETMLTIGQYVDELEQHEALEQAREDTAYINRVLAVPDRLLGRGPTPRLH